MWLGFLGDALSIAPEAADPHRFVKHFGRPGLRKSVCGIGMAGLRVRGNQQEGRCESAQCTPMRALGRGLGFKYCGICSGSLPKL